MNPEKFNQLLGQTLRNLRDENHLTQDDLARRTRLSRASIANMETGRQAMSAYQAFQIAQALDLPNVDTLFPYVPVELDASLLEIHNSPELTDAQRRQIAEFLSRSNT